MPAKGETLVTETVRIAERFHGPPRSGNGGYVCGLAASFIKGPAEVTLRAPPPLETPLAVVREGGAVSLCHGETEIAHARAADLDMTALPAPALAEAQRGAANYLGHKEHFFPTCFTCGPAHAEGLHIFTGPVREGLVAGTWTPASDLAAEDGLIDQKFVWAALDCPSYWALPKAGEFRAVLGRLTAGIAKRPRPDETTVVAAWPVDASGRKHRAASALYDASGALLARAEALWIEIKPEQFT
jgi:hypothetical protein